MFDSSDDVKSTTETRVRRFGAAAALLCGVALIVAGVSQTQAEPGPSSIEAISFDQSASFELSGDVAVREAAKTFLAGMSEGDADIVWMYATEEDQAAFGTEQAVLHAFSEVFPAFTQADEVVFDTAWQEGDTPFLAISLTDDNGAEYDATLGLWLDDGGDWKLVSAEVRPTVDYVASLR